MTPKVLIVDDDAVWLQLMEQELNQNAPPFTVATTESGQEALDILAADHVSAVVSDLRMPGIDGFELVNRVSRDYPDIPVMIVTAYDRPKTREVVFKSGASDYMVKPLSTEDLIERINRILRTQAEGGSLHNVSLETFLQLIEMESQTCTLRVTRKTGNQLGVLFFRDGELINARLGGRQGHEAAYEILSWSGVSLTIENFCQVTEKLIDGGLQSMLLNAMRQKDENRPDFSPHENPPNDQILLDSPIFTQSEEPAAPSATDRSRSGSGDNKEPPPAGASAAGRSQGKLESIFGQVSGVEDIYEDQRYAGLLQEAARIGKLFGSGELNAVYVNQKSTGQRVIVPGSQVSVIRMSHEVSRDRIIDLLL
ncbi:MAG: response regulator [Desulfobacteraceae bacterium]|nr:response regulator [Desulfobacteraceae bacterium]